MQHLLLRILCALFIGVISPLCCCRAAAVMGIPCPATPRDVVEPARACCGNAACKETSPDREPEPLENRPTPVDDPAESCPACPSCDGQLVTIDSALTVKFTPAKPVPFPAEVFAADPLDQLGWGWRQPRDRATDQCRAAAMHTGREAHRWHCALLI